MDNSSNRVKCWDCRGEGHIEIEYWSYGEPCGDWEVCPTCYGDGFLVEETEEDEE